MTRTTITLPEDLAAVLKEEARRRSTSVSEVVRRSLYETLVGSGRRKLTFAALCDDPQLPSGADIEMALDQEWKDGLDRRSR